MNFWLKRTSHPWSRPAPPLNDPRVKCEGEDEYGRPCYFIEISTLEDLVAITDMTDSELVITPNRLQPFKPKDDYTI